MSHAGARGAGWDPGLQGLKDKWKPIPKRPGYAAGMLVLLVAVLVLPVLYAAIVGGIGYGVYWHLAHNPPDFGGYRGKARIIPLLVYVTPALAGGALLVLLLKPILAPRARSGRTYSLEEFEEPKLHVFVAGVCGIIGAPPPRRIDIDCDVNASASFRSGVLSLVRRGDLVLTIGLPLVAGMSKRQFAGVLAHEFGHFAQGAGMRLTYVGRSIVMWFARAAWERDGWDEGLDAILAAPAGGLRAVALFIKLCLWIGRLCMKVLAVIGMALCSFMLRQMEFDADRYEVRLMGSEAFAPAFRRILELGECFPKAMEDSRRMFERSRELPEDFPALVADHMRRMTPESRHAAARTTREGEGGGWLSSHPQTRIAAAEALAEPGLYTDEGPAKDLFLNFDDACKKGTYGHFRGFLGNIMEFATFVPVGGMLRADDAAMARQESLTRYLGYDPPAWRPVFLAMRRIETAEDAKRLVERLRAARAKLKPLAEAARPKATAYREAHEECARWEQARGVLEAGFNPDFKAMGLKATTRAGVTGRIDALTGAAADAAASVDDAGDAAAARMGAALALLGAKGIEKLIPDAAQQRRRADTLLAAMGAMEEILPVARQVRRDVGVVNGIARTIKSQAALDKAKPALRKLTDRIRDDLDTARRIGGAVPDPLAAVASDTNLGEALVGATPGWREFEEIALAGETFVDRFADTCRRTLGELVHAAERVEQALVESSRRAKTPA